VPWESHYWSLPFFPFSFLSPCFRCWKMKPFFFFPRCGSGLVPPSLTCDILLLVENLTISPQGLSEIVFFSSFSEQVLRESGSSPPLLHRRTKTPTFHFLLPTTTIKRRISPPLSKRPACISVPYGLLPSVFEKLRRREIAGFLPQYRCWKMAGAFFFLSFLLRS